MAGLHGHGTMLAGASAGTIGDITNIDIGDISVDDIDVSSMDSTDKAREFIPGMMDCGEISFTIKFDKAEIATLFSNKGISDTWTITFSDGSTFVAAGYLKKISGGVPFDADVTFDAALKISGNVAWTPASS